MARLVYPESTACPRSDVARGKYLVGRRTDLFSHRHRVCMLAKYRGRVPAPDLMTEGAGDRTLSDILMQTVTERS